jgi:hypothetical protein
MNSRRLWLIGLSCFLLLAPNCSKSEGEGEQIPSFDYEVFSHTFEAVLTDTATGDFYDLAYSYPTIEVEPKFKHLVNFMISPMAPCFRESIASHGPLILIADDLETIVFSPMNHFFVSLIEFKDGRIQYGIEGEVAEIPAGMTHRFLMVRGQGVNATVEAWGKRMREDHSRQATDRYADTGLSYLGYWTDNGAAYYYRTHEELNEEDTLFAVKQYAQDHGIPYGYFQLDSWWYYKTSSGGPLDALTGAGLVRWEPVTEMFPDGLVDFQQRFGLPFVAHNRWFAQENDYRGEFSFVDGDDGMALPLERGVFDRFMEDAVSWGVFTYEQDWLVTQYWAMPLPARRNRQRRNLDGPDARLGDGPWVDHAVVYGLHGQLHGCAGQAFGHYGAYLHRLCDRSLERGVLAAVLHGSHDRPRARAAAV